MTKISLSISKAEDPGLGSTYVYDKVIAEQIMLE